MLKHCEPEFENALYDVVHAVGTNELGKHLGIKPGYLRRMAQPLDSEACFRARDLIPALSLAQQRLPMAQALAPLEILARALGYAVFPIPQRPNGPGVILSVSAAARAFGDLGAESVAAVDPRSDAGARITLAELQRIEIAGYALAAHVARIMAASQALYGPSPKEASRAGSK